MNVSSPFPPHDPPRSGAQDLIGYEVDLSAPDGTARVTLDLAAKHRNRNDTLHGGIHAMMLDAAAGFAASRHLAGASPDLVQVITLSLTTDYVAAVSEGRVTVTGRRLGGGFKIVYADAELRDADGQLCSRASGVYRRAA